jgi:glyoxylase-like metal-dependent hydrolase (beta-lactamase superfamily II)
LKKQAIFMKISVIHTGYFKLDGGAMFGIVPKSMWQKLNPPDENNLCTWATRVMLVETGSRKILIDTGIGSKQDAKFRSHFHPTEDVLLQSLAEKGVHPEDITDVFLTHLHFDHVGGACVFDKNGHIIPTFPNAIYWSNKKQWDWAMQPNMKEKASFLQENFVPLLNQNRLQFIDNEQDVKFMNNFHIHFTQGHTEALMMPMLTIGDQKIVFCADTMPASYHIGMPYVMSYDIRPLDTLEEKNWLLSEAAAHNWILFFEHDPVAEAASIKQENGRFVLNQIGKLSDFTF